jgi:site-specific DNA-methyltransferase (adenine-specific)
MKPYYEENGITIYHGDCREILPLLPEADLILTDPPYGLKEKIHDGGGWSTNPIYDEVLNWDIKLPLSDWAAILSKGRDAIVWGGNYYQFKPSRCWLIWSKINNVQTMADAELAWTSRDTNTKLFREIINPDGKREHPTQKPLSLMSWCIQQADHWNWNDIPKTILDPFMGSGTTLRAAKDLGRKAIGIEIEEKYCEIAVKRLAQEVLPL